jgi:hypothetical protein
MALESRILIIVAPLTTRDAQCVVAKFPVELGESVLKSGRDVLIRRSVFGTPPCSAVAAWFARRISSSCKWTDVASTRRSGSENRARPGFLCVPEEASGQDNAIGDHRRNDSTLMPVVMSGNAPAGSFNPASRFGRRNLSRLART